MNFMFCFLCLLLLLLFMSNVNVQNSRKAFYLLLSPSTCDLNPSERKRQTFFFYPTRLFITLIKQRWTSCLYIYNTPELHLLTLQSSVNKQRMYVFFFFPSRSWWMSPGPVPPGRKKNEEKESRRALKKRKRGFRLLCERRNTTTTTTTTRKKLTFSNSAVSTGSFCYFIISSILFRIIWKRRKRERERERWKVVWPPGRVIFYLHAAGIDGYMRRMQLTQQMKMRESHEELKEGGRGEGNNKRRRQQKANREVYIRHTHARACLNHAALCQTFPCCGENGRGAFATLTRDKGGKGGSEGGRKRKGPFVKKNVYIYMNTSTHREHVELCGTRNCSLRPSFFSQCLYLFPPVSTPTTHRVFSPLYRWADRSPIPSLRPGFNAILGK